jgi:hypothetical protein
METDYTDRSLWPECIRTSGAFMAKRLDDGRWAMLCIMAYDNTRLNVLEHEDDLSEWNFATDFYCYHDRAASIIALTTWDGEGDPTGWVRHMGTGRRREYEPDGTYNEWVNP